MNEDKIKSFHYFGLNNLNSDNKKVHFARVSVNHVTDLEAVVTLCEHYNKPDSQPSAFPGGLQRTETKSEILTDVQKIHTISCLTCKM